MLNRDPDATNCIDFATSATPPGDESLLQRPDEMEEVHVLRAVMATLRTMDLVNELALPNRQTQ